MNSRALLACVFLVLGLFGAHRAVEAAAGASPAVVAQQIMALREGNPPPEPGSFPPPPSGWIHGANCGSDPIFQVHEYNPNTYIIRQSKCSTGEGPFLYLLFGDDKVLLMDTGSNPNDDVYGTVLGVIRGWLDRNERDSIPLIVAHTHSHGDHTAGDQQFVARPIVERLVGWTLQEVVEFWGFENFPLDDQVIDLGGRVIDVLGTPGHQPVSLTLYDHNTHLLITADIVYPGHLFVFSPGEWFDFVDSLQRLVNFAQQNPVEWVMGCHIEYSTTPGEPYPWAAPVAPNEAPLEMLPSVLADVLAAAQGQGANPQCEIFPEFVIHPVYLCGITWNGP